MVEIKNILVVSVDRDNDFGRKANISGPIIGRQENVNAAAKLAVKDPSESDANCVFAAIKKYDEIKKQVSNSEIVTLIGAGKIGFESDRVINEQLDKVLKKFPADGFVLVTDGAEDDQILPILQSRAPVISKETLIIKQAKEVESTYYTIKEALKDPALASIVFAIPGLVLILYAGLFYLGLEKQFFQIISFVLGIYLILKGTGLEEKISRSVNSLTRSISLQRTSFPFYLAVFFLIGFGLMSSYNAFVKSPQDEILYSIVQSIAVIVMFSMLSGISYLIGKTIDAVHFKKAYRLRGYVLSAIFVIVIWFIVESARAVIMGQTDLNTFIISILTSFVVALGVYKLSEVLDVSKKITKLLIGLPVYSKEGKWLGRIENIYKNKNQIEYKDSKTNKLVKLKLRDFLMAEGKITLVS